MIGGLAEGPIVAALDAPLSTDAVFEGAARNVSYWRSGVAPDKNLTETPSLSSPGCLSGTRLHD